MRYVLVEYWGMYLLRLENGLVACLHGMGGSSRCWHHRPRCWLALTEMEMILGWERGNHYAAAVVAVAAVVKGVVEAVRVAFGPAVQDSRPRLPVLQRRCQWIRSSREGHCLNMPH